MSITSYTNSCQKLLKYNRCVTKIKIKDKKCLTVRELIFLSVKFLHILLSWHCGHKHNCLLKQTFYNGNTKIHENRLRILPFKKILKMYFIWTCVLQLILIFNYLRTFCTLEPITVISATFIRSITYKIY